MWDLLDDFVEIHGISMGKIHGQNHPTNPWIEDIRRIGVEKPTVVITFLFWLESWFLYVFIEESSPFMAQEFR